MNASKPRRRLLGIACLILLGVVGLAVSRLSRQAVAIEDLARLIAGWRAVAPLAFLALHVVATVLFVPRMIMGLASGAMFGPWLGAFLGLAGVVLGAASAFAIARFLAPDLSGRFGNGRTESALRQLRASGWLAVFVLRLIPVLPHALVNYGLGAIRISFPGFASGTALGLAPSAIIYAQLGAAGARAIDDPANWTAIAIWSAAAVALAGATELVRRLIGANRIGGGR